MRVILSIMTEGTDFDRRFDVSDEKVALELLAETLGDVEKRFLKKAPRQKDALAVRSAAPSASAAAKEETAR